MAEEPWPPGGKMTSPAASSIDGPATRATSNHCSFVMLAEFDIDKGSTLANVYPRETIVQNHDDHTLAELMLPDGAHLRGEDWTVFFLAEDPGPHPPGSDLTYVLNLVRTKHDASVRRGALVKALAVGTRHPCIQVFKSILQIALDDYFDQPTEDILAKVYDSINALDLSALPVLSRAEKIISRASERRDLFQDRLAQHDPEASTSKLTEGVLAHKQSRSSLRTLARLRSGTDAANAGNLPRPPPNSSSSVPVRGGSRHLEINLEYDRHSLPIRWPLDAWDDEIGEFSISSLIASFSPHPVVGPLHPYLHSNGSSTHPLIVLFNAILTYRRVIFLGHNLPSNTVASHVLAAAALASGCGAIVPGIKERLYPYANLITLDVLEETPGFIAGVTNPRFEELRCWDVLCNIETGQIIVHKNIEPAPRMALSTAAQGPHPQAGGGIGSANGSSGLANMVSDPNESWNSDSMSIRTKGGSLGGTSMMLSRLGIGGSESGMPGGIPEARLDAPDLLFMEDLHAAVQNRCSEASVRAKIFDHAMRFASVIHRHEEYFASATLPGQFSRLPNQPFLNGQLGSGIAYGDRDAETKDVFANAARVEGFRATTGYGQWIYRDRQIESEKSIRDLDVGHQIHRLRGRGRPMSSQEAELIFKKLSGAAREDGQVIEILSYLPPYLGGLTPVAQGLYHPSPAARASSCELLTRLARHRSLGLKFVQSLPIFHRLSLARLEIDRSEGFKLAMQQQQQQQQQQSKGFDTVESSQASGAAMADDGSQRSPYPPRQQQQQQRSSLASNGNVSYRREESPVPHPPSSYPRRDSRVMSRESWESSERRRTSSMLSSGSPPNVGTLPTSSPSPAGGGGLDAAFKELGLERTGSRQSEVVESSNRSISSLAG